MSRLFSAFPPVTDDGLDFGRMPRPKKSFHALFRPLSGEATRRRRAAPPEENTALQAMWEVIARVPRGHATTYGDVARAAGFPGRARQAGYALRHVPDDMHLPWYRIVGAGGKIAFPPRSRHHREQARLLRSEGVDVKNGRVTKSALVSLDEI
jgi:methylated-DNA-protein-cysteine methyltransferase related protein